MLTILRKLLNNNPLRAMSETDRKVLAICIAAAFAFWLILNLSRTYSIEETVQLNYLLDPERTLARDSPVPTTQEVEVQGPGWDLVWESIRFEDITVDFDLRGQKSLDISRSELERKIQRNLSSGDLSVVNLDFSRQTIFTAPKEGKKVPIVSRLRINFADGFIATGQPLFRPDSIVVTGPRDLLEDLTAWPTEETELQDIESDINREVNLAPPANSLMPSRETVRLQLPVEAFIQRTLEVPVTVINAPAVDSFQVIPTTIRLSVTLPQSSYKVVRADDFSIVADLGDIRNLAGKNNVPLTLRRQPSATISAVMKTRAVEYYLIN